jgi:hypothetical protein
MQVPGMQQHPYSIFCFADCKMLSCKQLGRCMQLLLLMIGTLHQKNLWYCYAKPAAVL